MKRRILCLLLAAIMLLLCVSCNGEEEIDMSGIAKNKTYSILFIGNSYTNHYDWTHNIFDDIVADAGYLVDIDDITAGGWTLAQHADPTEEKCGKKVQKALTGSKKYDFVVLQEQSVRPAIAPELFYDSVRDLVARVRAAGAQPILYCTWGRETGNNKLSEYGWTNESMTWKIAAAYQAIGRELDVPVVYVGLAFFDVYTTHSEINLYDEDKHHASKVGYYLSGLTLFAGIFRMDPTTLTYNGNATAEQAAILREAAKKAAFTPPEIPKDYQIHSENVTAKS